MKNIKDSISITDKVFIEKQTSFSLNHRRLSKRFSEKTKKLEKELKDIKLDSNTGGLFAEHREYCISTIIHSFCYLEAYINEVITNSVLKGKIILFHSSFIETLKLTPENKHTEIRIENIHREKIGFTLLSKLNEDSCLDKYNTFLKIITGKKFTKGDEPYQSIEALRKLRNYFVHTKHETFSDSKTHKLEDLLKSKFDTNTLIHENSTNSFFPDKCLGAGCAIWAYISICNFVEEFQSRILNTK
ncbi:MAG: hypothetical protein ACTSXL_00755 [Alphaproteobacteria bacterium]